MKNKFIALALVTLSIATTTVSCTKDDLNPTDVKSQNVQTAEMSVSVKTNDAQNATAKSVNRGDLHAWIKDVNITATSLDLLNYSFGDVFTLVDDASGDVNGFKLGAVALGNNRIDVATTTSTVGEYKTGIVYTSTATLNTDAETTMNTLKAKNPYAIYSASIPSFNVVNNAANKIENVELKTQHARVIAVFKLTEHLKSLGVRAHCTIAVDGVYNASFGPIVVDALGYAYWSNASTLAGKKVTFRVQLLKPDGTVFTPDVRATKEFTLEASKSTNKTYTISENSLTEQETSQTFIAQPWVNDVDPNEIIDGNL